ncbi:hypothetical protein KPG71_18680 [Roseovarius sp. PS-C2]|uniref:hypothetical protein n=1 Tax=Roseovarius sp. PS-C2 TaxID=2820814 RepID=UPI001C0B7346|nr:hypothetical protein [Roseovarius sp. PS-C2]MBU3262051.1 hypothetical protein [Roseovarius sp. PS-C2]
MWITAAFKFFTGPIGRWIGAALIVAAFVGWLRWDAGQDVRRNIDADSNAARLEYRETSEQEKDDVESISADDVLRELLGRLSGPDSD